MRRNIIANLQDRAREASLIGDWITVEEILLEGKNLAANNEWLQQSISDLENFAREGRLRNSAKVPCTVLTNYRN